MKPVIVLKIGGSLIAPKNAKKPTVDYKTLKRICREIGAGYREIKKKKSLIIVHGAGNFGHLIVSKTGIYNGIKNEKNLLDFAETQRLQNQLNILVTEELLKNGVPAFPFQSSDHAIMKNGRLKSFSTNVITELLKTGLVPVAFGVPACDIKQGCSILSGDEIAPYLAKKLRAEKIIHATDVDGVYTSNPKINKKAQLIRKISRNNLAKIRKSISASASVDVTGGMKEKVGKVLKTGIKTIIINGSKGKLIKNALEGKIIRGTVIKI